MKYFVIECEGKHPIMPIASGPQIQDSWWKGSVVTRAVPTPLLYTLDPDFPGLPKPMYAAETIPVMRDDVVEALRQAGVENVQFFEATLVDPTSGTEYHNYKAFNILSLVACADMASSEMMGTSDSTMVDADFHGLVIDESKTRGLLFFRLAENVTAIIAHETVKDSIERSGIPGFVFYGPGQWAG